MPNQTRDYCILSLGERHELCRKFTHYVPIVECHVVRSPKAVERREQQQLVFKSFAERLRLLDQQTCLFCGRLGFWCGIPVDVDYRSYESYLKPDLLTTQRGRGGQCPDLNKRPGDLLGGLDQRRAF